MAPEKQIIFKRSWKAREECQSVESLENRYKLKQVQEALRIGAYMWLTHRYMWSQ